MVGRFAEERAPASVALGELGRDTPPPEELVTVSGVVAQVCPTAGCWLTLRDERDDETKPVHVELLGFVVPRSREGHRCTVQGTIADRDGRVTLLARGIRFEH